MLEGEYRFLRMLADGGEMAVAWDRDVPQEAIPAEDELGYVRAPRFYNDGNVFVCVGSTNIYHPSHREFIYQNGRWRELPQHTR